jgi:hypothetical protein
MGNTKTNNHLLSAAIFHQKKNRSKISSTAQNTDAAWANKVRALYQSSNSFIRVY